MIYFGTVVDTLDPLMLGRVKVKIFDLHNNIETKDLGWSQCMMGSNTPAIKGIGHSVNLLAGSLVCGIFLDNTQQEFIVIGTLPTKTDVTSISYDEDGLENDSVTVNSEDNNPRIRGEANPHADEPFGTYEPESSYAPIYPYNNVMETESGHVREYDDTPGAERITKRHKSGTQYEIGPNGSKIERILRDNYQLVMGHDTLEVKGNVRIFVSGNCDIAVAQDLNAKVGGNMSSTVIGNMTADVTGNMLANIAGTTSLIGIGDISITQNGIDASLITLKSEYTKDDVVYKGNIKLDGEVSITENLVVEKLTTTSNSTGKIILDTHEHLGDGGDNSSGNTGPPITE